jgi:hypothetical protein
LIILRGQMVGANSEQQVLTFLESIKNAPFKDQLQGARLLETGKINKASQEEGSSSTMLPTGFSIEIKFKPRVLAWTKSN